MKLAIADPPYPPQYSERRDRPGGNVRVTVRSRAVRWYGEPAGVRPDRKGAQPADHHPEAGRWDDLGEHRALIERLADTYDGWAIATTPDGLGAYHPLPVAARVMAWHKLRPIPGGGKLLSCWEPVIVLTPEARRGRVAGPQIRDVLTHPAPADAFAGAKPHAWTAWVLQALGYDAEQDTVHDLFPGSGAVSSAAAAYAAQGQLL